MRKVNIYLAICDNKDRDENKWRSMFTNAIKYGDYVYNSKPYIYNSIPRGDMSDQEKMIIDTSALKKSDLVIVDLDNYGISTAYQIAVAVEYKIPVIGLQRYGNSSDDIVSASCIKKVVSIREMVDYVVENILL